MRLIIKPLPLFTQYFLISTVLIFFDASFNSLNSTYLTTEAMSFPQQQLVTETQPVYTALICVPSIDTFYQHYPVYIHSVVYQITFRSRFRIALICILYHIKVACYRVQVFVYKVLICIHSIDTFYPQFSSGPDISMTQLSYFTQK